MSTPPDRMYQVKNPIYPALSILINLLLIGVFGAVCLPHLAVELWEYYQEVLILFLIVIPLLLVIHQTKILKYNPSFVDRHGATVIFLLALTLRLLFAAVWTIPPISDFDSSLSMAKLLSANTIEGIANSRKYEELLFYYTEMHPNLMPFEIFQTAVFKVFGEFGTVVLVCLNQLASAFTCVFVFLISKKIYGRPSYGFAAGLMCALNPFVLFFASVQSNQHIAIFLFVFALYLWSKQAPLSKRKKMLRNACISLLLLTSHLVRAEMSVVLIALLCMNLVKPLEYLSIKKKPNRITGNGFIGFWSTVLILAVFFIGTMAADFVLLQSGMVKRSITSNQFRYKLMVGLNIETNGRWSRADHDLFKEAVVEQNDESLVSKLHERSSIGVKRIVDLAVAKTQRTFGTWYDHFSTTKWNSPIKNRIGQHHMKWINGSYMVIMLLCLVFSCIKKFGSSNQLRVFLGVILFGFVLAFAFIESQPRYMQVAVPLLAILSSFFPVEAVKEWSRYGAGRGKGVIVKKTDCGTCNPHRKKTGSQRSLSHAQVQRIKR